MPSWFSAILYWSYLLISCMVVTRVWSTQHVLAATPAAASRLTDLFPRLSFNQGFSELFGGPNVQLLGNGTGVNLTLNKYTGSGFSSQNKYYYGFFSSAIKLPAGYSAGVVVAFYMSNADTYPNNHDEIDFELLGHEEGKQWVLQTNIYGKSSVGLGREEKYNLWFDPTQGFHYYSIIWNNHHVVFLVDNVPVREVNKNEAMSAYPSKPMTVYSTIWDGSQWATEGGKKPVNYNFAPFTASFREMEMEGCMFLNNKANSINKATPVCSKSSSNNNLSSGSTLDPVEGQDFIKLSQQQKIRMHWVRQKFMFYSYCNDRGRYQVIPPECKS